MTFKMLLSLFWKNARFPQKGAKVGGQLEKITFFVYCCKLAHLIFLIFHIHLEGIKGFKLLQPPFLGKFSFCQFCPFLFIFGPKINFFVYCSKLDVFDILQEVRGYKLIPTTFLGKFSFLPSSVIFG